MENFPIHGQNNYLLLKKQNVAHPRFVVICKIQANSTSVFPLIILLLTRSKIHSFYFSIFKKKSKRKRIEHNLFHISLKHYISYYIILYRIIFHCFLLLYLIQEKDL